jgi:hypothetical protein
MREGDYGHQQYPDGGDLAGGEQLLVGVEQSGKIMHNSLNQWHGEQEQMIANSLRRIRATEIG